MDSINETDIEENLRKHYKYIRRHLNWKDLVIYYKLFRTDEKDDIKSKGKTDYKEATELALDKILNSNRPNRFSTFVEALREAGFQKIIDILLGEGVPKNEYHRMIIGDCEKNICEHLNPIDVLHLLVSKDVLRNSDAEVIRTRDRMEGHGEANFELMSCLPKRNRQWYEFFMEALKESKYDNLVQIIKAREDKEAQLKGIDGIVEKSVIDRQSSPNSVSGETKEKTIVTDCKQKKCKRREYYCPKHRSRFCRICDINSHKECSIYDLAYEVKAGIKELEKDSTTIPDLCRYVQACITWRGSYRKELEKQANELIKEVRYERAKLDRKLTDFEITIDTLKSKGCKTLDEEINMLKEELKKLTKLQDSRPNVIYNHNNPGFDPIIAGIELTIALERVNSVLTTIENTGYPGRIELEGASIREIIQNHDEARCVVKEFKRNMEYFNVSKEVGCCLVTQNKVALCDRQEMKLRMHANRMLVNNLDLPSKPWDIGLVSDREAVISLPESKIIKFISLSEKPELSREIMTPKPCWCLFCIESDIYVCCGEEGVLGEVQIFAQNGLRKRSFRNTVPNTRIESMRIFVRGNNIYATFTESNSLHIINIENSIISSFEHKRLHSPSSIFVTPDHVIFVGDTQRNKLQEFKLVDEVLVLLKNYDLELKPQHILERKLDSSLVLVGMSTGI